MCLAVPGRVLRLFTNDVLPMADVAFGELVKSVCVACIKGVRTGDYVVVHAGFAIAKLDVEAAERTLKTLEELTQPHPDPEP